MARIFGGDKLQRALADLARKVSKPGTLEVGFLEGATYPDGTKVAEVATWDEFGTATQPPRPFMRNTIRDHEKEWGPQAAQLLKANDYDAPRTLTLMGELIAGQVREEITTLTSPPLAESTIRGKGSDKPLIDTTHMLHSIDYEVKR